MVKDYWNIPNLNGCKINTLFNIRGEMRVRDQLYIIELLKKINIFKHFICLLIDIHGFNCYLLRKSIICNWSISCNLSYRYRWHNYLPRDEYIHLRLFVSERRLWKRIDSCTAFLNVNNRTIHWVLTYSCRVESDEKKKSLKSFHPHCFVYTNC